MEYPVSISVIMATYNTEISMLKEAVDSILNQTFRDYEFLIINDGSTNGSDAYLKTIQDARVQIIWNPENIGITKSLNIGLKQAKGKYIARMDADDISLPTRLEKEFAFMEAHPDVIICGTRVGKMNDQNDVVLPTAKLPKDMEDYRVRMLFVNPGPSHPTTFFRHQALLEHHILYDEKLVYAQDYGMWETISHYGKIYTLDETLLYRRIHAGQISVSERETQMQCDKMTQKKMLSSLLGDVTDAEVDLHYFYSTEYFPDAMMTPEAEAWYDRLIQENKSRRVYDQEKLEQRILIIKKSLVQNTLKSDMPVYKKYRVVFHSLPFLVGLKMIVKNTIRKNRSADRKNRGKKNNGRNVWEKEKQFI